MESEASLLPVLLTSSIALIIFLILFCIINAKRRKDSSKSEETDTVTNSSNGVVHETFTKKQEKRGRLSSAKKDTPTFSHRWLACTLKGHGSDVSDVDFSPNGKYVCSCSDDRSIILWNVKEFTEKEKRPIRGTVEFDHARFVRFSPDSKAVVVALAVGNKVGVYKLVRKEGSTNVKLQPADNIDFPEKHKSDIIAIGISCTGKFIMSASADTTMIVWDLHGHALKILDTKQGNLNHAAVSPCGRLVASSGFTPDVKVYDVSFSRDGEFVDVVRAFELKGHSSGVLGFAFNTDSTRMVTASKDGHWKLWDTKIEYKQGQEPYLLETGNLPGLKVAPSVRVAMAPNAECFAIAIGNDLRIFETDGGLLAADAVIDALHQETITGLTFSTDSNYLATCGDRHIHVFYAVPGYRAVMRHLEEQLRVLERSPNQNAAHVGRLKAQYAEVREKVVGILYK